MDDHLKKLVEDLHSRDGVVRRQARETLVQLGAPAAPHLRPLLASPHKQVRWEALKTLAAIGDPDSLERFLDFLDDPSADLRWLAATGLIRLGSRSIRPVLQALTDPGASRGRREMGRRVLGRLTRGDEQLAIILAPLMEVIDGTDRAVIAQRAARALSDFDATASIS